MDPNYVNYFHWNDIRALLTALWGVPLFTIGFAFILLLGQAVIPSLVRSQHLPGAVLRLRPPLYCVSFVSLVMLAIVFFRVVDLSDVLRGVYAKWWI